jgi:hypothetical protein
MKIQDLTVKNCQPYAKGWQINAYIDGVESEMTFYGYTKRDAIASARSIIKKEGRLPHEPYRG